MRQKIGKGLYYTGLYATMIIVGTANHMNSTKGVDQYIDECETETTTEIVAATGHVTANMVCNAICTMGGALLSGLVYAATVGRIVEKKFGLEWPTED